MYQFLFCVLCFVFLLYLQMHFCTTVTLTVLIRACSQKGRRRRLCLSFPCVSMSVCIGNLPKICLKWNISLLSMCSNLRFQDLHSLIISGPGGTKFSFQLKSNYNRQGPAEQSTYGSITGVELKAKIIENTWAWGWQYNVFSVMINRKGVKLSGVKFGKRKLNAHMSWTSQLCKI